MTEENTPKAGWQPGEDPNTFSKEKKVGDVKVEIEVADDAFATQEVSNDATQTTEQPEHLQTQVKINNQAQTSSLLTQLNVQSIPSNNESTSAVIYEKGCCGAAWEDVRNTKGWFGKVCLLALLDFVPILNWVIQGYALRWARQLFFGKVEEMPSKVFCDRAFVNGAMQFLVSLLVGFVIWIATLITAPIPIIGFLVLIAIMLLVRMIMNFCYVRMAIFDQLGEAFAVNKGFNCIKKSFGKAFCVEFMPSFIIGLIMFAIVTAIAIAFFCINGFAIFAQIASIANSFSSWRAFEYALEYDPHTQWQVASVILTSIATCLPWFLITAFLINICSILITLIKTRAAGHFVTRYCSEWKDERKFQFVLQCEEQ